MRILSRLQFPIPVQSEAVFEEDLQAMLDLAERSPGYLDVDVTRRRVDEDGQEWVVYLILSEWTDCEAMYAYLNEPSHLELCHAYRPKYQAGRADIRRYQRLRLKREFEYCDEADA